MFAKARWEALKRKVPGIGARSSRGFNSSVRSKLAAGSGTVLVLAGVVAWAGIRAATEIDDAAGVISNQKLLELEELRELDALAEANLQDTVRFTLAEDTDERTEIREGIGASDENIAEHFEHFSGSATGERMLGDIEAAWAGYVSLRDPDVLAEIDVNPRRARQNALGEVRDAFLPVRTMLSELQEVEIREARALRGAAHQEFVNGRNLIIAVFAGAALIGVAIILFQSRRIAGALSNVTHAAKEFANGDLTRRADVNTSDEIEILADAFNTMAERLHGIVNLDREIKEELETAVRQYSTLADAVARGDLTVRVETNGNEQLTALTGNLNGMVSALGRLSAKVLTSAQGVGSAASQMLETAIWQSATVSEQSFAINQTTVTVEELRASSEQAARRAVEVSKQAQRSVQVSEDGTEVLSDITERMGGIKGRVEAIAQNILTLSEQTQQIGNLTATVDDIAEQSNLLALNATIEAARAGEHGRGFAVVAAEVRSLAEQSKQATAQVRSILSDIQTATNSAVMTTEHGIRSVEDGAALAERAQQAIVELAETINETAQAAHQIAAAAQQQTVAVDQVAGAIKEINQAANRFVTGVEDSKSAAEGLDNLARELQALTESYKV
jgi:methyl-accepting chemotaxis protein